MPEMGRRKTAGGRTRVLPSAAPAKDRLLLGGRIRTQRRCRP